MMKIPYLSSMIIGITTALSLLGCGGAQNASPAASVLPPTSDTSSSGTLTPGTNATDTSPISSPSSTTTGAQFALSIAKSGSGTVASNPAGIDCGTNCNASYASDTEVTLVATSASGFAFKGWGGACSGSGFTCTVTMSIARNVTANFESTSSTAGSIDAVIAAMPANSWKALPSTQMKDVCPLPYNSYACSAVISAWSGGAYDEARDRMVIFGGGHYDSWYNNIFAFDLVTMKWGRLSEMASSASGATPATGWNDKRTETCGFYPKGPLTLPASVMNGEYVSYDKCFTEPVLSQLDLQQPRSTHSYGGLFVDQIRDRYCHIGTAAYYPSGQTGSPVAVCFDPVKLVWSRMADRPEGVGGRGQTALDSNGHVWSVAGESGLIGEYDPVANTWKTYGYNNYDAGGGTDIDRKRNQLYVLFPKAGGGYAVRRWDLNSPASLNATTTYSEINTSGDLPNNLGTRPGFVYVDAVDRFYAWGGGRDVYTLDPATQSWKRLAAAGDDPGAQQQWGTYGRFRYSPSRGVFVLVNDTTQNVFIYKPGN